MRIAKADADDFKRLLNLLKPMEALFGGRMWSNEESWTEWDDDDTDKKELLKIRREMAEEEGDDVEYVDNRLVLYEFIRRRFILADRGCWQRIIMAADALIKEFCDQSSDILEYHPFIERAVENTMLGE